MRDDRVIHLVAADTDTARVHNPGQGNYRHLGRATPNVNDHVPDRLFDGQTHPDCGGHGLLNQVDGWTGTRVLCGIPYGPLFHLRDPAWYGNDDPGSDKGAAPVGLSNKVTEHRLSYFKIGDDSVF